MKFDVDRTTSPGKITVYIDAETQYERRELAPQGRKNHESYPDLADFKASYFNGRLLLQEKELKESGFVLQEKLRCCQDIMTEEQWEQAMKKWKSTTDCEGNA